MELDLNLNIVSDVKGKDTQVLLIAGLILNFGEKVSKSVKL